ncbi:MAG TPA: ATP-binding protein [Opitutus sp.]|nr:ATP-binding protein [Opitutus sp.]
MPRISMAATRTVPATLPAAEASGRAGRGADGGRRWRARRSPAWEYLEVVGAIAGVTLAGNFVPLTYHTFGLIYLLAVIALSLRVGRWPVLAAAVLSVVAWSYVFIPPRLSFAVIESDDGLLLGTYLVVALVAGQLTARIRAQELDERERERRASALFQLTRVLAGARTLDEAAEAALRQADTLFEARTALLLGTPAGELTVHPAGSFLMNERERDVAEWAWRERREAGRFTAARAEAAALHVPMLRAQQALGVFVVCPPEDCDELPAPQRDLIDGFAAQIALLVEREQLQAAGEKAKFFAESDRLHRTLLDSVSHELKTPLAVLRTAGEKLATDDTAKRASLLGEIRTATSRLDHLVANLLDQTRLESGGLHAQPDWCDARDVVHAARRAVSDALAGRPFTTSVPADMPLFLADAPLLEQVLANLLLNAARHTPPGTAVGVTAGIEVRDGQSWVFIRVDDHGAGIPAELRGHLFQKFRRGSRARAGGLGLGLSIVRGFVEAQGGVVTAGDNPDGGARFTVYLPHVAHGSVPGDES